MTSIIDLGFRVTEFKKAKPGDIFIEYVGNEGLSVSMRILSPTGTDAVLTFHPRSPFAVSSTRHEDRDIAIVISSVIGPTINSENLLPRRHDLKPGALMFAAETCLLRVNYNNGDETWDVDLSNGKAKKAEAFTGPFWTNRWSINAIRGQRQDTIFEAHGGPRAGG